jgi:hypothetical protein
MAKSTTKNILAESFDIEKIKKFTDNELTNLLKKGNSELPLCYQVGTDVLVGNYRVTKVDDKNWQVSEENVQMFTFFTRKDAIFYCIALHKKQFRLAKDIKDTDELLGRLEFDAILYRLRYKQAQSKDDIWGEEFYSARYTETMNKVATVKREIRKNLELARTLSIINR